MSNDSITLKKFQQEIAIYLHGNNGSNIKKKLSDIYMNYSELFNLENIINSLENIINSNHLDGITYLSELMKENLIINGMSFQNQLSLKKAQNSIIWNGELYSLQTTMSRLLLEPSRINRKELFSSVEDIFTDKLNPIYKKLYKSYNNFAEKLNLGDYTNLCISLLKINKTNSLAELHSFLDQTNHIYFTSLEFVTNQKLNLSLSQLERHDAFHLWNLNDNFRYSDYNQAIDKTLDYLKTMGFGDILRRVNFIIDKSFSRSFCIPLIIPDKIILVYSIRNRADDFKILFHELGHALHLAGSTKDLTNGRALWINPIISEAFAFLFEGLVTNKSFVTSFFGSQSESYYYYSTLNTLYLVRFYIAKLLFEYSNQNESAEENTISYWGQLFSEITGFKASGKSAFYDRDFFMGANNYIKGWFLFAQINNYLEDKYGDEWFSNNEASAFLMNLWLKCSYISPEDISTKLGYRSLNGDALIKYLKTKLLRG
ncbi:hypothetical protein SAMN04487895_102419 [Paenibacillus sophorae]|uniref:Oligoendopeptidase F n=1 Tax=Paenibacillus sophorae TaxID=1333845 RepID=A0A1H8J0Q0_9BACL|nr:hypothetical protein [Paenibacillus sophorae]QWU16163.1 hypothetical protein KP014_02490 [Paenibacillus sophorae]SEN74281.1 hypothetical protein SAMN04487895_102419 [Paenibacillus sophorae]